MWTKKLPLLILSIFCLCAHVSRANNTPIQEDYYTRFRNITLLDGLSHERILDIKQDHYGFIWIATAKGLNRYDGYTFKHFFHTPNDSTSLPGDYITSLTIDRQHNLWVGTKKGLACYDYSDGTFSQFPLHSPVQRGISNAYVRKILADSLSTVLWVETVDGTLNRIETQTGQVDHFKHRGVLAPAYDYHELYRDHSGRLWLGGRDFGPLYFDEKNQNFRQLPVGSDDSRKKRDNDLACIFQDNEGDYWMSATDGFYQYYPGTNTFTKRLSTSTFDIVECCNKKLWLASAAGLLKYNKQNDKYTLFRHNANNRHSLVHDRIKVLFADRNDNLWIGTDRGISILYHRKNLFTHYRHIPELEPTMPHDRVRTFLDYAENNVWIGTHGGGVVQWDKDKQIFTTLKGTAGERISTMLKDSKGDVWLGMWSGTGFLKYDKKGKISRYAFDPGSLKRDWYNDLMEFGSEHLLTGLWGAWGVQFFNRKKGVFEAYNLRLPEGHTRTYLDKIALQDGKAWGHWRGVGIHRYDVAREQMEGWGIWDTTTFVFPKWRMDHHYHYDKNIRFKEVYQLVENDTQSKSYWCTDSGLYVFEKGAFRRILEKHVSKAFFMDWLNSGVFVIATPEGIFTHRLKTNTTNHFPVEGNIQWQKVYRVNGDHLLLVSESKAVLYNLKTGKKADRDFSDKEQELFTSTNDVLQNGKNILFATSHGLVVMNSDLSSYALYDMDSAFEKGLISEQINGVKIHSPTQYWLATEKGLLLFDRKVGNFTLVEATYNTPVKSITQDKDVLWMATMKGMASYKPETGHFSVISNMTNHKLSSHLISFIEQDRPGNIWVGTTNNGVNLVDTLHFNIRHFLPGTDSQDFWGENATDLAVGPDGTIYISSNAGLNIYSHSTDTFSHLSTAGRLPSNNLLGLEFDNEGWLWMVCDQALLAWNPDSKQLKTFGKEWGLLPHKLNGDIALVGNEMLLPSEQGFYAFDPRDLLNESYVRQAGITGARVFANDRKSDLLESGRLELKHNENFFTIEFSDFLFSEDPQPYYYRLKGVDPDWVETGLNYASYTNIAYGNYEFLLTTESGRTRQAEPIRLSLTIIPPLWKRPWFLFLEFLFAFVVVFLFAGQWVKQYQLREKNLRTEQRLLRSQMNPHFVFNALIAIQSFILKNDTREAGKYLSKFARLMRLFLQNTRQDLVWLDQELQTLENYMELQRLRFDNSFDFSINYTPDIKPEELQLPPMMAQPFVENAIEHGFKDIAYQGKIELSYRIVKEALEIRILDNGIGIKNTLTQEKHKSMGISITSERLQQLSNRKQLYSLTIKDRNEENPAVQGTEVRLLVPYHTKFKPKTE